jgi:hypothetical protein
VRAAGFDLQLVPHDDHDGVLIDDLLRLTPAQRLTALEAEEELFASALDVR